MVINRALFPIIQRYIGRNKVLLIKGARRTGKTFLLDKILASYSGKYLKLNGELPEVQAMLAGKNLSMYRNLLGNARLLAIDEAQSVREIGQILKIIIDHFPDVTIIATGSSSFDLINKTGEPLTGRQLQFTLFPVAQLELSEHENPIETRQKLEERMIYGSYPEVINLEGANEKKRYLTELTTSYLLKDILQFEQVRNSHKLLQLLQLLAYQAGQEVSNHELAKSLGVKHDTVARYLDLLSKVFIIYSIGAYGRNLRKEVVKSLKWYFVDNGIRNAIINNFSLLSQRNDEGQLWESYLMSERMKRNSYKELHIRSFFWRTYDRQEIDLIEEKDGKAEAFEFKWKAGRVKPPVFFRKNYPDVPFSVITPDNYQDFIGKTD
ncbi:MAG: AAA family ATPase [Cyclobacteriaceae bacterium]|nr:AAA family ATPase [Cyclobacteriaceae bacterium]MCX7636439.1 AAA family ATPase [Cyclobacteriaceae bacterium]